jgi:hypothetical protein
MARRHRVAVLAVLLVLAGGCQQFGDDQTVTPAPVPSAEVVPTTDTDRLVQRHEAALRNTSHTTTVTLTITYPNGSVGRRTDKFRVGADETYLYERRTTGPYPATLPNVTLWQSDRYEVRRQNGSVTVTDSPNVGDTTLAPFLRRLLGTFDLSVTETESGSRLTGEEANADRIPLPGRLVDHRDATVEADVRGAVVRTVTIDLRADDTRIDRPVRARYTVTVEDVNATTPTRPTWAEGATATE